jgi:hypothetical protein
MQFIQQLLWHLQGLQQLSGFLHDPLTPALLHLLPFCMLTVTVQVIKEKRGRKGGGKEGGRERRKKRREGGKEEGRREEGAERRYERDGE